MKTVKRIKFPVTTIFFIMILLLDIIKISIVIFNDTLLKTSSFLSFILGIIVYGVFIIALMRYKIDKLLLIATATLIIPDIASMFIDFNGSSIINVLAIVSLLFIVGTVTVPQLSRYGEWGKKLFLYLL